MKFDLKDNLDLLGMFCNPRFKNPSLLNILFHGTVSSISACLYISYMELNLTISVSFRSISHRKVIVSSIEPVFRGYNYSIHNIR